MAIVKMLLRAGADLARCDKDKATPLHVAVNTNDGDSNATSEVEACLIAAGADGGAADGFGRIPLHYAFIVSVE